MVSLIGSDDSNNQEAEMLLNRIGKTNPIFIFPFISLVELYASARDFDFLDISTVFSKVLTHNTSSDLDFIISIDPTKRKSLKANDLMILALCKRFNAKLISFDKKLLKAYEKILGENLSNYELRD